MTTGRLLLSSMTAGVLPNSASPPRACSTPLLPCCTTYSPHAQCSTRQQCTRLSWMSGPARCTAGCAAVRTPAGPGDCEGP
ncbi:hypothetical protein E2C01_022934 [Portunus trituberculatus]|uniref:Uncharacterized protein n=1 Tax=Portunus trituberculatus TaxID=210409 RepID=A0A5B7E7G7_PORTR|nr:hypothetical protein [Portunus trituberculatus]